LANNFHTTIVSPSAYSVRRKSEHALWTPTTKPYSGSFQYSYFPNQQFSPFPCHARDISVDRNNPSERGL